VMDYVFLTDGDGQFDLEDLFHGASPTRRKLGFGRCVSLRTSCRQRP
jgi:hypothetical protein